MRQRSLYVIGFMVLGGIGLLQWQRTSAGQSAPPSGPTGGATATLPTGASCLVYLRGDATGMAVRDRTVDLDSLVTVKGTITQHDANWLVLKNEQGKIEWIANPAVAAVLLEK